MNERRNYFLCGIGGSGMLPLATILKARGHRVEGSDRALDQGRTGAKFDWLAAQGIALHAQDGSGLVSADQILVASAAVEESVPDVAAARRLGAKRMSRAELLADLFNAAQTPVGIAGTSGKSTVTAMTGWILHAAGRAPTVMNGAVMKNFADAETPFASAVVGAGGDFVSELDESDGSIALFNPRVGVLTNVSLDHKSMEELRRLFGDFLARADTAIVNLDNAESAALGAARAKGSLIGFGVESEEGRLGARQIAPAPFGVAFTALDRESGEAARINLKMPGRHNVSNALAAIGAALACGVSFATATAALERFQGVSRRLEFVGAAAGVTVIDDFAHNPDKIAASLATLKEQEGRLLVLFQPHGFGPLKLMREGFVEAFSEGLGAQDILVMPDPVYYGGTTDRSVSSADIVAAVRGPSARAFADRAACGEFLIAEARDGDRIVVMGARDDTLSSFANDLVRRLGARDGA